MNEKVTFVSAVFGLEVEQVAMDEIVWRRLADESSL